MTPTGAGAKPVFNMLVARQLDDAGTGNATYLAVLLRAARRAGMTVRIVFSPRRAFSNRPWLKLHPLFAGLADELYWPQSVKLGQTYLSLSPSIWGRFAVRLVQEAVRRISGDLTYIHSPLADPLPPGEAQDLARACDRRPGAVACAEYSALGAMLPLLKQQKRRAVLLHDLFSLRALHFQGSTAQSNFTPITLEQEAGFVRSADVLFYASVNERTALSELVPTAKPLWLRPEVPEYARTPASGAPRAVFLGTRHGGNTDALQHLVDDIWPRVRAAEPQAELWVAGSICADLTPAQASAPGVKPLGRVEDLASIGGASSIGLAPTRFASGVSIKVAEYLRLGMACVAYPVALEGFGSELSDLVDVVEGPDAFADRVVALMHDDAKRSERAARGYAEAPKRLDNSEAVDYLLSATKD
jgi:glycosyltransferase involved in cell wall biosynthesis